MAGEKKREQVSIRINPGSLTATEINPTRTGTREKTGAELSNTRRTFEISYDGSIGSNTRSDIISGRFLEGAVLQAEVWEDGKIRIL